ncbi:uncharacterized protein EV422DRAFT_516852 [Fimicolochytrium jonesii]|uniref:uncharacterized protein n=1 Tax=Fimicolochytrium jonesii TaxID=1396493 RepID=UPI0022FE5A1B|nr:uncharacterized protein EV422DRAFT_516852 [Fimicolochytrium jonesii]KAI8824949.1 hypothetical protein EV422DRAFT_516852 [Fimicolochytrium jonesii]
MPQTRNQLLRAVAAAKDRETHVLCDIWNQTSDEPCSRALRRGDGTKGVAKHFTLLNEEMCSWLRTSQHFCLRASANELAATVQLYGCKSCMKKVRADWRSGLSPPSGDGPPPPSSDGTPPPTGGDTPPPRSPRYTAGPPPTVRTQSSFDPLPISEMRRYKRHLEPEFVLDAPTASARRSRTTSAASVIETLMPKPADNPVEGAFWGAVVAAEEETADEDAAGGGGEVDAQINVPDPAMDVDATQRVDRSYEQKLGLLNLFPFKDHHGHLQHPVGHMEEFIVHMNTRCDGLFDTKMKLLGGLKPKWQPGTMDRKRRHVFVSILLDLSFRYSRDCNVRGNVDDIGPF